MTHLRCAPLFLVLAATCLSPVAEASRLGRDGLFLTWEDQPLTLTGYSEYGEMVRLCTDAEPGFCPEGRPSLAEVVEALHGQSANLIRIFALQAWPDTDRADLVINPFAKLGVRWPSDGSPSKPLPVYDLRTWQDDSFDPTYFARLRALLEEADLVGSLVELSLFDHWGGYTDAYCACLAATTCNCSTCQNCVRRLPWAAYPFNPENNELGLVEPGTSFAFPNLYDLDRAVPNAPGKTYGDVLQGYVQKMVRETAGFDNVVFELGNEMTSGDPAAILAWHQAVAGWIREVRPDATISASIDPAAAAVYAGDLLDVVTVHGLGCRDTTAHRAELAGLFDQWHKPLIDDDDGTWNCGREIHENVEAWAELALSSCAQFNHKDSTEAFDWTDLGNVTERRGDVDCPRPLPEPPVVALAGTWGSRVLADQGGPVQIVAGVVPGGEPVRRVALCTPNGACSAELEDDGVAPDLAADDDVFALGLELGAADVPAAELRVFELRAYGWAEQEGGAATDGRRSLAWPYLSVGTDRLARGPYTSYRSLRQPVVRATVATNAGSAAERPVILAGGFSAQSITDVDGGSATLSLLVQDPQGVEDIARVEIFMEGELVGTISSHTDEPTLDAALFSWVYTASAGMAAGRYLVEAEAVDAAGHRSTLWPYLTIEEPDDGAGGEGGGGAGGAEQGGAADAGGLGAAGAGGPGATGDDRAQIGCGSCAARRSGGAAAQAAVWLLVLATVLARRSGRRPGLHCGTTLRAPAC